MNTGVHVSFELWFSQGICPVVGFLGNQVLMLITTFTKGQEIGNESKEMLLNTEALGALYYSPPSFGDVLLNDSLAVGFLFQLAASQLPCQGC